MPAENWEEIIFYEGAIQPILNHNCNSCHNPKKLKGEFDLTSVKGLLAEGENGEIIIHGNLGESTLLYRLIIQKEDEEHTLPKGKRQLRKAEIELIKAWIESVALMDRRLGASKILTSLISRLFVQDKISFYPETTLKAIHTDTLSKLREKGFFIENI